MPYASPQPRRINPPVCPLPRSLATTSGISVDFSSSPYLDVSVQAVPHVRLFDSTHVDRVLLCRVSPFGNSGIKAYVRLPQTYRSLSRPSSALDAKAFPLRSYQLDRNADLCRSATGSHQELCRLQIRFIVVLCYPFKKSTKVYFVTSLLLARNFLLAFTVQFSRCRPLICFQDQIEMLGRLPKHFNLFLVEVTGLEPVTPCLQSKCSTS